ncbi:S10 family serine carboxypeptidase-like protein [Ralstonia sp. UBA689]|uniref:S10 family serine carboxypeptidase-like protein n=1 Tax=Ralstonia sp. UBA689 TaxID=1947373 RepID=UPI0025E3CBFB|nr:peptidase [Ralstonia sp. UBA689]
MPAWIAIAAVAAAALVACGGGDDPPSSTADTSVSPPATVESEQDMFARVAPADKVLEDANIYDTTLDGSIELSKVNEETSVKRHTITMNGKELPYVARAGHLIAYSGTGAAKTPEAAVFYTAYTRDGLPKEQRPVTFLWNGGPGSASIWLHMGSWGPKRLKTDAPNIVDETKQPDSLPFEENAISLLDQSDIVFVDPPGTGYSTAIAPKKNADLWGTDADARVVADFITSYINKYNRQSSPKYLYGESYGGIRTPIVANLLEQAGTSGYAPDPSGKPAKVLAGFILNSPLVNYNTNCEMSYESCAGHLPSYAMTADFHKKSTKRGAKTQEQYLAELRLHAQKFNEALRGRPDPNIEPAAFASSPNGQALLSELQDYTGIPVARWKKSFNLSPRDFERELISGYQLGRFDGRMKVPSGSSFRADEYIDNAFLNQMKTYMPDFLNYRSASNYQHLNNETIKKWHWWRDRGQSSNPQSITDIQAVLIADPGAKILVLHGYEDLATPGFQTELDLAEANLDKRIPIKWFEGGHMTYNTESSRGPLKQAINDFYQSPARAADGSVLQ